MGEPFGALSFFKGLFMDAPKKTAKILPTRFSLAENTRNVWSVVPEVGIKPEDMVEPSYWAHVSAHLRPCDRIEAHAEDGTFFAEFLVVSSGRQTAKVVLLRKIDLEADDAPSASDEFSVQWKGPHHKFAVVRLSDRATLQHSFETKEAALGWLSSNSRTLAA